MCCVLPQGDDDGNLDELVDDVIEYFLRPSTDLFAASASASEKAKAQRFEAICQAAVDGKLEHWEDGPPSLVALVMALDQFPRTIHKGRPLMYSGDEHCSKVGRVRR